MRVYGRAGRLRGTARGASIVIMRCPGALIAILAFALAGCGGRFALPGAPAPEGPPIQVTLDPGDEVMRPRARPGGGAGAAQMRPQGRTAAALDTTTEAERAAARRAAEAAPSAQALGQTLAALGPPTEPGFWLRTGLVQSVTPGRIETSSGTALAVELRPSGRPAGAGSEISLAALRALEQPLTALIELQVFALP